MNPTPSLSSTARNISILESSKSNKYYSSIPMHSNSKAHLSKLVERSLETYRKIGALENDLNDLRAKERVLLLRTREESEAMCQGSDTDMQAGSSVATRDSSAASASSSQDCGTVRTEPSITPESEAAAGLFSLASSAVSMPSEARPRGNQEPGGGRTVGRTQLGRQQQQLLSRSLSSSDKIGGGAPLRVLTRDAITSAEEMRTRRRGDDDAAAAAAAAQCLPLKKAGAAPGAMADWSDKKVQQRQHLQQQQIQKLKSDGSFGLLPLRKRSLSLAPDEEEERRMDPPQRPAAAVPTGDATTSAGAGQHVRKRSRLVDPHRIALPPQLPGYMSDGESQAVDPYGTDTEEEDVTVKARTMMEHYRPTVGYGNVTGWRDYKRSARTVRGIRARQSDTASASGGSAQQQRRRSSLTRRGSLTKSQGRGAAGDNDGGSEGAMAACTLLQTVEMSTEVRRTRRKMTSMIEMRLRQIMCSNDKDQDDGTFTSTTKVAATNNIPTLNAKNKSSETHGTAPATSTTPDGPSQSGSIVLRRPALLASALESRLYDSCATLEEYADQRTLDARLRSVAMLAGRRIERAKMGRREVEGTKRG